MSTRKVTIDISLRSYLLAASVFLGILFFQHIYGILLVLFVAFLVNIAVSPAINFFESKKIPRSISALLILLLIFSLLIVLVVSLITPLIQQTTGFLTQLPNLVNRLTSYNIDFSSLLSPEITSAPRSMIRIATGTFSSLLAFVSLIVISYYMVQDRPNLKKHLTTLFGESTAEVYLHAISEVEVRLGSWVRGELILMALIGVINYVGFVLIGIPSAIPLAVIAGILELVPTVGPTIAAIPAVLVGLSISPTHALMTLGLALLAHQLENHIFVPKVMQHAVGLPPVVTIVVLSIGFRLGGPLLAVLSLPLVISLRVVYAHLHHPTKKEEVLPV